MHSPAVHLKGPRWVQGKREASDVDGKFALHGRLVGHPHAVKQAFPQLHHLLLGHGRSALAFAAAAAAAVAVAVAVAVAAALAALGMQ
eukprot:11780694-Prorocentrum_lima.AAC.1